jgi:protein-disulfide isomerase
MRLSRFRSAALALAAIAASLWAPALAEVAAASPDDMSLGNPNARVTVVEYASASCPHCAHFNNEVFPAFKAKYIDSGKVRYVFREFLTPPAEVAAASFIIARCAGKDKYFSVLDSIFHGQQKMYETGDVKGALMHAAGGAGLTEARVEACLQDRAAADALEARVERYARQDGIQVTPTFVINGRKIEGAASLTQLDAAIAAAH